MKTLALLASHGVAAWLGYRAAVAARWWVDNVPSHNCEELA